MLKLYEVIIPDWEGKIKIEIRASNKHNALIDALHLFPKSLDSDVIDRIIVREI
jgi:hypothetical protein